MKDGCLMMIKESLPEKTSNRARSVAISLDFPKNFVIDTSRCLQFKCSKNTNTKISRMTISVVNCSSVAYNLSK